MHTYNMNHGDKITYLTISPNIDKIITLKNLNKSVFKIITLSNTIE